MPGCLNRCYLYWETHSLEKLDPKTQVKVEKELEKARLGVNYDASILSKVVNQRCLGDFLKKDKNLKQKCWHYWELPQELTIKERMEILHVKKGKKWKIATLIFGLLNVVLLCVSVYLGLQQPQISDLKSQNISLQSQLTTFQNDVNNKSNSIIVLQNDIATINSQNSQMYQKIVSLQSQLSKCQKELSKKIEKYEKLETGIGGKQ